MKRFLVIVTLLTLCFATTSCESYLVGIDERPEGYYDIGDYYNENGKEGVVFEISEDHLSGKIMSVYEWYLDWCYADHVCYIYGDGDWWLPTVDELKQICRKLDIINETLSNMGFTRLHDDWSHYWSSDKNGVFYAWGVRMPDGDTSDLNRSYRHYVRAVTSF